MKSDNFPDGAGSNKNAKRSIRVVNISEYSPSWVDQFSREADFIRSAIKCAKFYIDHVGSTAVKGLAGKPIVDILISLSDWSAAGALVAELEDLGYDINEKCDDVPRYFLTKYSVDGCEDFHVHICEPGCHWGREMLIFKSELAADDDLARAYENLKRRLANKYREDVQSYMRGKKNFIENKLRDARNEFGVNKLLTHQRAESNKAERLQMRMIVTQFATAAIAAASVYSNNNKYLFAAAILIFILMLLWLVLSQGQQRHRSAGDQARRAVLLISGLDFEPSAGQKLRISDGFNVPIFKMALRREEDHFATRATPGYRRLSEMIEESSYWTRDLQQASARAMTVILMIVGVIAFITGGAAVASLESDSLISLSRAMIAIMVFVVSSDFLGLLFSYRGSTVAIDEIFKRAGTSDARDYLEADILLLMSDYNAAIERSPAPLPWIYEFRHKALGQRWQAYVEAKLGSRDSNLDENKSG